MSQETAAPEISLEPLVSIEDAVEDKEAISQEVAPEEMSDSKDEDTKVKNPRKRAVLHRRKETSDNQDSQENHENPNSESVQLTEEQFMFAASATQASTKAKSGHYSLFGSLFGSQPDYRNLQREEASNEREELSEEDIERDRLQKEETMKVLQAYAASKSYLMQGFMGAVRFLSGFGIGWDPQVVSTACFVISSVCESFTHTHLMHLMLLPWCTLILCFTPYPVVAMSILFVFQMAVLAWNCFPKQCLNWCSFLVDYMPFLKPQLITLGQMFRDSTTLNTSNSDAAAPNQEDTIRHGDSINSQLPSHLQVNMSLSVNNAYLKQVSLQVSMGIYAMLVNAILCSDGLTSKSFWVQQIGLGLAVANPYGCMDWILHLGITTALLAEKLMAPTGGTLFSTSHALMAAVILQLCQFSWRQTFSLEQPREKNGEASLLHCSTPSVFKLEQEQVHFNRTVFLGLTGFVAILGTQFSVFQGLLHTLLVQVWWFANVLFLSSAFANLKKDWVLLLWPASLLLICVLKVHAGFTAFFLLTSLSFMTALTMETIEKIFTGMKSSFMKSASELKNKVISNEILGLLTSFLPVSSSLSPLLMLTSDSFGPSSDSPAQFQEQKQGEHEQEEKQEMKME